MERAIRCPFCATTLPPRPPARRWFGAMRAKDTCTQCGKSFNRSLGHEVAEIHSKVVGDFEQRLASQLKALPVCDRAAVLGVFGLRPGAGRPASGDLLFRSLAETLAPQIAGLARGAEGGIHISRAEKNKCAWLEIDALIESAAYAHKRLRVARTDVNDYLQLDPDQPAEGAHGQQIAR